MSDYNFQGKLIRDWGIETPKDKKFRVYKFHWPESKAAKSFAKFWNGKVDFARSSNDIFVTI